MHQSIATIESPEFINLQPLDINPLMSSCEIKVLYLGENRNQSFISKEVAYEMAKTLRGAPIVGYYKQDTQDFADHGQRVVIDDEGIKFECLTKPYGFVSPDAKVWFQKFEDTDEFGNSIIREYMMTTGYLWTGQFEECKLAVEGDGRPHSMELDPKTLEGHWSTNIKKDMEFFIINDAIFSKLCILGENVEPCFEGSSVTSPKVSTSFSKIDDDFKNTLFTMMQDLKLALEGGSQVDTENKINETLDNNEQSIITENQNSTEFSEQGSSTEVNENGATEEVATETSTEFVADDKSEDDDKNQDEEQYAKKDEDKDEEEDNNPSDDSSDTESDDSKNDEEDEKKKKYELLETAYTQLQNDYTALEERHAELQINYQALVDFKNEIEDAEKDKMIEKFFMLSDDDKKDIVDNKANYTIQEIEEKLSVICFRKKVHFDLEEETSTNTTTEQPVVTFNLSNECEATVPAWLKAVDNVRNNKN